ncbi:MAG TPA: PQQ-binding-like beta-propeller repeat protein, partial [Gemmataceae bacterium]|nr:PQQ-binding-like beta-propeller repeat protein [Gemmataceae bacterium]
QINARNEGTVSRLAFSPDGKALATACRFAVRVWDVASGREMQHFEADSKVDEFLHFSADGKLLAAGEEGGTVEVWELATGKRLRRWRPWRAGPPRMKDGEPAEGCLRCALFPDGRTLLWQIVRWKLPALSESGRVFDRGKLRACDTATGKQRWQVECVREEMGALAVSPDGKLLAVGSGPVQILDAATGRKLVETEDPGALSAAHRLAFSPDGKTLVGAYSNTMCLWDARTGKKRRDLPVGLPDRGELALALSPDGRRLAFGGRTGIVRLHEVATGRGALALPGLHDPVDALRFSSDGRHLTARSDGALHRWRVAGWEETGRFTPGTGWLLGESRVLAVSGDARVALCQPCDGEPAHLRDLGSGKFLRALTGKHADLEGWSAHFSADGRRVFVASRIGDDQDLRCHRVDTGEEVGWMRLAPSAPFDVTADGRLVAWAREDGGITLADVDTGKAVRHFGAKAKLGPGQGAPEQLIALSPDGQLLAATANAKFLVGDEDEGWKAIRVWRVATGEELPRLILPPDDNGAGAAVCLAFSPDGRTLAIGQEGEKVVRLWEPASGQERGKLDGHRDCVRSLAFGPDGKLLASGGNAGVVLVWDIASSFTERPPLAKLSDAELAALWGRLADSDARRAWEAVRALVAAPRASVPFLRGRLRPVRAADPEKVVRLVADLDSDHFAVRDRALRELGAMQEAAAQALTKAVRGPLSLEARRQAERLLARLRGRLSPRQLQQVRAVEALEHIATPEARRLLGALAGGMPEARLTLEAKATLRRLAARGRP